MPGISNWLEELAEFMEKVPWIRILWTSGDTEALWWIKFSIDIWHPLAWYVIQELGHILNYLSPNEKLPTAFKPISPPPYLNGWPENYLSWVLEATDLEFLPKNCLEYLEGRLPNPINDLAQWTQE